HCTCRPTPAPGRSSRRVTAPPGRGGKHQGGRTIRPSVTDGDPHPRENGGDPTPDPGILGSDKWALSGVTTVLGTEHGGRRPPPGAHPAYPLRGRFHILEDRKSTRLNSSH